MKEHTVWSMIARLLARHGALLALCVLVAISAVSSETFLRPENLLNIARQQAFIGIIAIGMTFVIISGGIDLSVGSLVALLGVLGLVTMERVTEAAGSPALGIAAGCGVMLAGGPIAGIIAGTSIAVGKLPPFIATLGLMAIYRSLALAMADGGSVRSTASTFNDFGRGGLPIPFTGGPDSPPLQLHWPIVAFAAVAITAWALLRFTTYGVRVRAVGGNETAAKYAAVSLTRVRLMTYAIIGACCGISALLVSARLNSVSSAQTGVLFELDAIAAVVIGGAAMSGGRGSIGGTVVGVLLLGVIANMLNQLSISPYYQGLFKGLIIVAAVLIQRPRQ